MRACVRACVYAHVCMCVRMHACVDMHVCVCVIDREGNRMFASIALVVHLPGDSNFLTHYLTDVKPV